MKWDGAEKRREISKPKYTVNKACSKTVFNQSAIAGQYYHCKSHFPYKIYTAAHMQAFHTWIILFTQAGNNIWSMARGMGRSGSTMLSVPTSKTSEMESSLLCMCSKSQTREQGGERDCRDRICPRKSPQSSMEGMGKPAASQVLQLPSAPDNMADGQGWWRGVGHKHLGGHRLAIPVLLQPNVLSWNKVNKQVMVVQGIFFNRSEEKHFFLQGQGRRN